MPDRELLSARRRVIVGALLLALPLGLGILASASLPADSGTSQWTAYRSVLVETKVPEASVLAVLSAAGVKGIVSESTQPVLISDWAGLVSVPLPEARSRLLPGDPRLDPYLERLGLWFRARAGFASGGVEYRVFYIEDDSMVASRGSSEKAIRRSLAQAGIACAFPNAPGSEPARGGRALPFAVSVAVIIAACAASPLFGKAFSPRRGGRGFKAPGRKFERIAFRLLLALPWIALARRGESAAALAALWASALAEAADRLDLPFDELRNSGSLKEALSCLALQSWPSPVLPAVAILASVSVPAFLPSLGIAVLGSFTAIPGFILLSIRPEARRRFVPLPIAGPGTIRKKPLSRSTARIADNTRAVLACGVLVAWGLSRILVPSLDGISRSDIAFPRPKQVHGSLRPLPAEARARASSETGEMLPSLASYLVHRAQQEAAPYLRYGELRADPFATVRLLGPSVAEAKNAEAIAAALPGKAMNAGAQEAGAIFTDEWARAAYEDIPELSIEGMLLRQGFASVGALGSGGSAKGRPLAPIESLLYIILLVPPLGRILLGAPRARDVVSGELRQEA
jgi:hypothetical protein